MTEAALTTEAARPNLQNTDSLPQARGETAGSGLRFDEWWDKHGRDIRAAQIVDGYAWLCDAMVNAPDQGTFQAHITDGYNKKNWFDHQGRRGGKEAFNAYWDETKSGVPLVKIAVKRFSRDNQNWHGHPTITRLWEEAQGQQQQVVRNEQQSRRQRIWDDMEAEQIADDARVERAIAEAKRFEDEQKAAEAARALTASIAAYHKLPETKTPGLYFCAKGFEGVHIPNLKRSHHKQRGGCDMLPIQDAATGEITSLAYFWDKPFLNTDNEMVRKTFAFGGRIAGCGVFLSGYPPKNCAGTIRTGEGVATVLTVQVCDDTQNVCYVAALTAKNLASVPGALERRCTKATHQLILDNDWQKALEFDEQGRSKPNTGLEIGHKVAMKRGFSTMQPDFSGTLNPTGTLSDFNDLWQATDDDEVQRQLVPRQADPEWAFKGVRESEQRRLRALFGEHELTIIHQPYLEPKQTPFPLPHIDGAHTPTLRQHLFGHAGVFEQCQGAGVDPEGFRVGRGFRELFNNSSPNVALIEKKCCSETHGSCTYNQRFHNSNPFHTARSYPHLIANALTQDLCVTNFASFHSPLR